MLRQRGGVTRNLLCNVAFKTRMPFHTYRLLSSSKSHSIINPFHIQQVNALRTSLLGFLVTFCVLFSFSSSSPSNVAAAAAAAIEYEGVLVREVRCLSQKRRVKHEDDIV